MKDKITAVTICVVFLIILIITFISYNLVLNKYKKNEGTVIIESDFNLEVLKQTNEKSGSDNYLVSPYSIEIALGMLRDGADGNTQNEITKVIGNNTKKLNNKTVHMANAMFIKDQYKEVIENKYVELLKENHKAEILYDKFDTPEVINKWTKEKTRMAEFTKKDGTKMNVNMMHNTYETEDAAQYIKTNKAQGIIIPYKEDSNLEYIAIMPDDNIDEYIKNLDKKEFEKLSSSKRSSSKDLHINVGLPKYSYSYDYIKFKEMLVDMGIKDAFNKGSADFTNIIAKNYMKKVGIENLYVSTAIHKTNIDLNEKGTKAAAVTYFGIDKATGIREDYDTINISFNKPFLYMIRDKEQKVLLFVGVVNTPSEYIKNVSR